MKTLDRSLHVRRNLAAVVLIVGFVAGCATPPETTRTLTTPGGRSLKAGFVYEEEVYAAGPSFSLADFYWRYFFPQAATAFKEAVRFDSYDEALRSDVDIIVVTEATVHGARKGFKMALEVVGWSLDESELMRHGFREKTANDKTAEVVFEGLGKQAAALLSQSRKLRPANPTTIHLTP